MTASKWVVQVVLTEPLYWEAHRAAERLSALGPRVSLSAVLRRCLAAALPLLLSRVSAMEGATDALCETDALALREALR